MAQNVVFTAIIKTSASGRSESQTKSQAKQQGPKSTSQLAARYLEAAKKKDFKAVYGLVYWHGTEERSAENVRTSIKSDLQGTIASTAIEPLAKNEKLEYT